MCALCSVSVCVSLCMGERAFNNNSACFAALCQIYCVPLLIHTISSFFVKLLLCAFSFPLFLQSKVQRSAHLT